MPKHATEWIHSIELFKDGARLDSPTVEDELAGGWPGYPAP